MDAIDLLILTAADEKFARTLAQFLLSMRRHAPKAPVIVYDLGLSAQRRRWLSTRFPEVAIRDFPFVKYPAHFRRLYLCAWKPAIIAEHLRDRQKVIWLDAGTIIRDREFVHDVSRHLSESGYYCLASQSFLHEWTHPETLKLMHTPTEVYLSRIVPAGVLAFDGRNPVIQQLVSDWLSWCLDEKTIEPRGANRSNHRNDQSIFNGIFHATLRQKGIQFTPAGEIDISSHSPLDALSTRNYVPNRIPLWCDSWVRFAYRIMKKADQFSHGLKDFHRTYLSGFHRLAKEKFEISIVCKSHVQPLASPWYEYWADPFLVTDGKVRWIFFEKYEARTAKGVIAVVGVDSSGRIVNAERSVLSEHWHLSYPHVWQSGRKFYMIPESSAAKTVDLYEAVEFPHRWLLRKRLMFGIDAADTTVLFAQGRYWLFCAVRVSQENPNRTLHIYHSRSLMAHQWTAHPANNLGLYADLPNSGGRGAGRIFFFKGKWVRPMQWNPDYYGQAIRFMHITKLDSGNYEEIEGRFDPGKNFGHGHHIDFQPNMIVCDFRTRQLSHPLDKLKRRA